MKAEIRREVKVVLNLSQEEAEWLITLMQNPLLDHEPEDFAGNRKNLFTVLKDALDQADFGDN